MELGMVYTYVVSKMYGAWHGIYLRSIKDVWSRTFARVFLCYYFYAAILQKAMGSKIIYK